jgi:hypothetical protein
MDKITEGHYSPRLLYFLTLVVGLNVLDTLFTMIILDLGGVEVNPLVCSAITVYGDHFWIWKFSLVSVGVILLCLYSRLKYLKEIIVGLACFYLIVVVYQITLLNLH